LAYVLLIAKVGFAMNPGESNPKGQQLLRKTDVRGTDHNARVWILTCQQCSNVYGANSTDAWERKCPKCQDGKTGLRVPTERDGEDWTHDEHVIAFQVYNQIEFGTIHIRNPEVIKLAALLGRKVGSASRKLANFARLDPFHRNRDVRGLEHGAKGEAKVWDEFASHPEELALESARLLAARSGFPIEQIVEIEESELPPPGLEREALVRLRVNQNFFRKRVLSAYAFRCCVTGLTTRALLVASHIIPWAKDKTHRLNPKNGLCLNALHDRAFDRRLMWVGEDFRVCFSRKLRDVDEASKPTVEWLLSFAGQPLLLSKHFSPEREFLASHARWCEQAER
jgi:putative restriction endonuclease